VKSGAQAGRVIDRVTGEAAPTSDEDDATRDFSDEDRVDLARERVKQAVQALTDAKSSMERKQSELQSRQESLERAAEKLATKRSVASRGEGGAAKASAEERRLIKAQLAAMEAGAYTRPLCSST